MAHRRRRNAVSRLPHRSGGGVGRARQPQSGGGRDRPDAAARPRVQPLLHRAHGAVGGASDRGVRARQGLLRQLWRHGQRGGDQARSPMGPGQSRRALPPGHLAARLVPRTFLGHTGGDRPACQAGHLRATAHGVLSGASRRHRCPGCSDVRVDRRGHARDRARGGRRQPSVRRVPASGAGSLYRPQRPADRRRCPSRHGPDGIVVLVAAARIRAGYRHHGEGLGERTPHRGLHGNRHCRKGLPEGRPRHDLRRRARRVRSGASRDGRDRRSGSARQLPRPFDSARARSSLRCRGS